MGKRKKIDVHDYFIHTTTEKIDSDIYSRENYCV